MHVLGKVFLGLTIVLAAVDAYLATVLHAHRTHWQRRIESSRQQLEQVQGSLVEARKKALDRTNELNRIQNTWGSFVVRSSDPNVVLPPATHLDVPEGRLINAQSGTLAIRAGAAAGLPEPTADKPVPVVQIFATQADGTSRYLGEFALRDVQADQSAGVLTHQPPLPVEAAALQQLQTEPLRVRPTIPPSWRGSIADFFALHALAEQKLDFQRNQLRIQTEQLDKSEEILAQRLAELNGDANAPEGSSQQVLDGLVVTIRNEEAARNAELQQVDRLRHLYARKVAQLNDLVEQNRDAVSRLPGYQQSQERPEPRTASAR